MSSASEAFLRRFHDAAPGGSPRCFARGRLPDGASTYAWLARRVHSGDEVLDLACGDGLLLSKLEARGARATGIDLSPGEVEAAQARGVRARVGRVQALPFPRDRFDAALCSWALMLLDELPTVLSEVHRVVRPGGSFHAVVGVAPPEVEGNLWPQVVALYRQLRADADGEPPRLGDPRARDPDALAGLLADAGFVGIDISTHPYDLSGTEEQVEALATHTYDYASLDDAGRAALVEGVRRLLRPRDNPVFLGVMEVSCLVPAG